MKLGFLEIARNAHTAWVSIGRFAGPFYLCIIRAGRTANFRWNVHLRIGSDTFAPTLPRPGIARTWTWR